MSCKIIAFVAAGGALGSVCRYLFGVLAGSIFGKNFPWGTIGANIIGCIVMGILIEFLALRWSVSEEVRAFLIIGLMGGFTTFSSFSLDFVSLLHKGQTMQAFFYVLASVIIGIGSMMIGMHIIRNTMIH